MNPVIKRAKEAADRMSQTIDGWDRSKAAEEALNDAAANLSETEDGKLILDWLRSVTTNTVGGANETAISLAYREGMRAATYLIHARVQEGMRQRIASRASKTARRTKARKTP